MKHHRDPFEDLSRYYDPLMEHVDYERWFVVTSGLSELLPKDFVHLDAACGTAALLQRVQRIGWKSMGFDLSHAMLRTGLRKGAFPRLVQSDMRHLPFLRSLDYITCLFDSINFLLDDQDLFRCFGEFYQALRPEGLLYCDIITERMVLEHFADQSWTESNGGFSSTWATSYDRNTRIAETTIRVGSRPESILHERTYDLETVLDAITTAGFDVLGAFDAETWRKPTRKTLRIDIVATPSASPAQTKALKNIAKSLRHILH